MNIKHDALAGAAEQPIDARAFCQNSGKQPELSENSLAGGLYHQAGTDRPRLDEPLEERHVMPMT
ncbi:hypothetical protein GCM10022276_12270 [Sphingomonas limnosediminicola]|uniref:Uncharacterized protein n=1 Tax=Sphingomonas limnosediminicola TaxID=940133 RepID=A0ABP7L7P4_9SPHN